MKPFMSETKGSVAVIAAFCFVAVAICAGTALDFARASRQRQALSAPTTPFTEGASYTDKDWKKVMVVMTDGSNDWGAELSNMNGSYYGGYGYTSQSATRLGMSTITDRDGVLDARTAAACNAVKTAGDATNPITVYTIIFGSPDDDSIELMQGCASDPDKYFYAPDSETLKEAFEAIGTQISRVYLSK